MRFVLQFGAAELEPVLNAIRVSTEGGSSDIFVLPADQVEAFNDQSWKSPLEDAIEELKQGTVASIWLLATGDHRLFESAFFYPPHFCGHASTLWRGSVEYEQDHKSEWVRELVSSVVGLSFVSLAMEEPLDLETAPVVTTENFPWDHWRLFEAAVADQDGRLNSEDIRQGVATAT